MTTHTPETLRDRVAKAILSTLTNPWTRAEDWLPQADAALAAIPKLSHEARETILDALHGELAFQEKIAQGDGQLARREAAQELIDAIEKARAELERLP